MTIAKANNLKPWLRAAYDKHLLKYDSLIMPTITFVAPKIPRGKISVRGRYSPFSVREQILFTITQREIYLREGPWLCD